VSSALYLLGGVGWQVTGGGLQRKRGTVSKKQKKHWRVREKKLYRSLVEKKKEATKEKKKKSEKREREKRKERDRKMGQTLER